MAKYFEILFIVLVLIIGVTFSVFAETEVLGFDDDTMYVRVVKYRYDRNFPSSITYTDYRGSRKFRGKININWNSIQKDNNMYKAIYEGTLYDVGYAKSLEYILGYWKKTMYNNWNYSYISF